MRTVMQLLAVAALGASLRLLVPTADAQGQVSPQPQQAAPSADITDQQLDAAAKAVQRMNTVKQTYQKKIDAAAPGDKQRLMSEGNDALEKAVTDQGLTVDEYNRIITVAENDPAVRAKLLERLHQPRQSQQSQ
jgi:predicted ATPase with chaperone activity